MIAALGLGLAIVGQVLHDLDFEIKRLYGWTGLVVFGLFQLRSSPRVRGDDAGTGGHRRGAGVRVQSAGPHGAQVPGWGHHHRLLPPLLRHP